MKTSPVSSFDAACASGVAFEAESFIVQLTDGRAVSITYAWFPSSRRRAAGRVSADRSRRRHSLAAT